MSLFHHPVAFQPIDPLGDGLGDEIAAEQREPEAIILEEQLDEKLPQQWDQIMTDWKNDPDVFQFAEDE